ncbi:MAG: GPO family capsid scaffolding protein [Gammaproteobacteria bacterium]|nr:GPO family capsid scaffolding protein [Gammaproteobacteria bacterium]
MAKKSKFFRIATEGATTDGRTISREWIQQMATAYDPEVYGARINLEHYRGVLPDGPFKAYGDVLALKAEEMDGKLCLLAQLDPTDDLVELSKKRQKIYSSMEVDPNFAQTGSAYLVGLAVTDSPASLGTEMLQFCAKSSANPYAARKQGKDNLFSEAVPVELELEDETAPSGAGLTMFSKVMGMLKGKSKSDEDRFADHGRAIEAVANSQRDLLDRFAQIETQAANIRAMSAQLTALSDAQGQDREALTKLTEQLTAAPDGAPARPAATGGADTTMTDC